MWRTILMILVLNAVAQEQECIDELCAMPNSSSEWSTTTEVDNEGTSPTTTATTTVAPPTTTTSPAPPLSPAMATTKLSTVCLCDLKENQCDINCCCDTDCSTTIRQIFTHCIESISMSDPRVCYSADFLFRKPASIVKQEKDGLFCIVRDNIAHKKVYPSLPPIKNAEEFSKLASRWGRLTHTSHMTYEETFDGSPYHEGSTLWAVQNKKLVPMQVSSVVYGDLCLGARPVKFLNDMHSNCMLKLPQQEPFCSQAVAQFLRKIANLKLITNPTNMNVSDVESSVENCLTMNSCTPFTVYQCSSPNMLVCKKTKMTSTIKPTVCKTFGLNIDIRITYNETEGIQSVDMYIQPLNNSELLTSVKFLLNGDSEETFKRSGNPGYINGKPLLAGKKLTIYSNDTTPKKEAIEMAVNPSYWMTIMDDEKGRCSPFKRQNILFNQNIQQSCFLSIDKRYFSKAGCTELQKTIYDILINESLANFTANVNWYVGQFGNSRVEKITDWLQIIVDNFDLVSTKPAFENSTGGMTCRGIHTHMTINIAFAKAGSYYDPQSKIVGVLYRFGNAQEITVRCNSLVCKSESWKVKLKTDVNFMDMTTPAIAEYAKPPSLEIKFPHDFFYPFFAGGSRGTHENSLFWCTGLILLFINNLQLYV